MSQQYCNNKPRTGPICAWACLFIQTLERDYASTRVVINIVSFLVITESSDSRERRSRSYSRDRSLSISKNTGHTPPPRERSPEKVLPVTTNSAEKTTDDNSSAGKKEVTISSCVTVVENQSTDGKADHNPKKGANDTPLTEEIVNVLGSRLKEDKEFSPAVHSHFVSIFGKTSYSSAYLMMPKKSSSKNIRYQ
ncbi:unnamed protein product [Trichogramma brassicae]|uniref:Uncharacterized protein n=1 Tax=Trichogramma brassicae TaxID=86971 RepID=A0A6H5ITF5_9HYME|nr:unnamed protein product [Trichogramma brassicae]